MYKKNLYLIHDSQSPFHRKVYIHLLLQCHLFPIWPVLPRNPTYILIFLPPLSWANLPYTYISHSMSQSHVYFVWPFATFWNKLIFYGEQLSPSWWTTPCQLSATAYSLYSQLPSISRGCLLCLQPEDIPCRGDKTHLTWKPTLKGQILCITNIKMELSHIMYTERSCM
jgi:hypothetical protein